MNNIKLLGLSLLVLTLSLGNAFGQTQRMQCPQRDSFKQGKSDMRQKKSNATADQTSCPQGQVYDFKLKACISEDSQSNMPTQSQMPNQSS